MEITQQEQNQPQLSEHEQAMVDKVNQNEEKVQTELSPDADIKPLEEGGEEKLFAGKYKSVEDMEKAYKELESKLGNNKQEEVPTEQPTQEEAKQEAEAKGVDFDALTKEFTDNGQLSEDTYKDLEGKGISKDVVDNYIAGQQAILQANVTKLQSIAGGEEGYTDMINWASNNLSADEQAAFNETLSNPTQATG